MNATGSGTTGEPGGPDDDRPALVILAAGMAKRFGGGCKPLAPLGLHGEAVIDLTASDALRAGFGPVVLVLGPQTGPAIEYHVGRAWPPSVAVSSARQEVPLGTAHALLCAHPQIGDRSFGVVNADDVYGTPAFETLVHHLRSGAEEHALVGFPLRDSVSTDDPVTRGICEASDDGLLVRITERKQVTRVKVDTFRAADGKEPENLDPDGPVSMNLWGFRPAIWPVLESAVTAVHDLDPANGTLHGAPTSGEEVLLPEVVGSMIRGEGPGPHLPVRVLAGSGRCVGVTHAADLPIVRNQLATMVARGERVESPWEGLR
jgi:hypothetical protein